MANDPDSPPRRSSGLIQSVDRALAILESFSVERPELGVSELSRSLGLNKSTAFGLLSTLEHRGYVEQNPETGKYRLGLRVLDLGTIKLSGLDLARVAKPVLRALVDRLRETVHLAIYDRGEVVYIDKIEGDNALQISSFVGKRNPSYCTGVGKCLLAFQPAEELERVIALGLPARTPETITEPGRLRAALERVRAEGHATDDEEIELGLACVAAPVRNRFGEVCAAVSVSVPTIRASEERRREFTAAVEEAARAVSEGLGYRPRP